jgi:cytochrome c-type biogenesis protein CcmF
MIAEFGLAALWLAAALAGLQLLAGFAGLREEGQGLATLVRPAAVVQALLCALAFGALLLLFARTDLSVALVAKNSHSAKPFIFKVAGAWGNHEGSMLLWVAVMALAGGLIAAIERRLPERTMLATLAAQAFVGLGFYAFLLFSSNPFERLPKPRRRGWGSTRCCRTRPRVPSADALPRLRRAVGRVQLRGRCAADAAGDPRFRQGHAAVGAGGVDLPHARASPRARYWAYYELGWGGWWFWDPVENASLMPWLAATALLHSASVLARATRCGLDDPARRGRLLDEHDRHVPRALGHSHQRPRVRGRSRARRFILALLAIYIGGALLLFVARAGTSPRASASR